MVLERPRIDGLAQTSQSRLVPLAASTIFPYTPGLPLSQVVLRRRSIYGQESKITALQVAATPRENPNIWSTKKISTHTATADRLLPGRGSGHRTWIPPTTLAAAVPATRDHLRWSATCRTTRQRLTNTPASEQSISLIARRSWYLFMPWPSGRARLCTHRVTS